MLKTVTRRHAIGAAAIAAQLKAASWQSLTPAQARDIEAITSQIIPTTETPGAREAGVIHFIDRALATWEADKRAAYRTGLADLHKLRRKLFPGSTTLAGLSEAELRQLITNIESTPFFELLRTHTALGFLGSPTHGGNRDGIGWAHIGFEHRMSFQPPFGHYDAEAGRERE